MNLARWPFSRIVLLSLLWVLAAFALRYALAVYTLATMKAQHPEVDTLFVIMPIKHQLLTLLLGPPTVLLLAWCAARLYSHRTSN